jgi:hypothetical protein
MRIEPIIRPSQQPQAEPCEVCETVLFAGQAAALDHDLLGFVCTPCAAALIAMERELHRIAPATGIRQPSDLETFELISK